MDAQILQTCPGDQLAHGIGHGADAQLDAGAVRDQADHQLGDPAVHVVGRLGRGLDHRIVRPLHETVDLRDVHPALFIAEGPRDVFVHLGDHII